MVCEELTRIVRDNRVLPSREHHAAFRYSKPVICVIFIQLPAAEVHTRVAIICYFNPLVAFVSSRQIIHDLGEDYVSVSRRSLRSRQHADRNQPESLY